MFCMSTTKTTLCLCTLGLAAREAGQGHAQHGAALHKRPEEGTTLPWSREEGEEGKTQNQSWELGRATGKRDHGRRVVPTAPSALRVHLGWCRLKLS